MGCLPGLTSAPPTLPGRRATSIPHFTRSRLNRVSVVGPVVFTAPSSNLGPSGVQVNTDGVPVDLAAYGNGRIPRHALAPVATPVTDCG